MTQPGIPIMTTGVYRHTQLERVVHGLPFAQALMDEVMACRAQRVLIVAAPQAQGSATLERLREALGNRYVGAFCGALPHVPFPCVQQAAQLAHQLKADHLVALGGGSVIDTAKAMAFLLQADEVLDPSVLLDECHLSLADPSRPCSSDGHRLPITAIPQTLSAAEFTWFAGVSDPKHRVKHILAHAAMAPRTVIFDPALTLDFPLTTFLASGIKAMDHAIERLVALSSHPMSDAVSIHSLKMLSHALPVVHRQPGNLEARLQCQLAAWLSITGGSTGVKTGASHALGHMLGIHAGVMHGLTSCALLAPVLRWNATVNQNQQVGVMSALGCTNTDLGSWVQQFIESLGLPVRLRDLGVLESDLPLIAEKSLQDPGLRNNPRPVHGTEDVLEILRMAW